jgi:hypothetical protein
VAAEDGHAGTGERAEQLGVEPEGLADHAPLPAGDRQGAVVAAGSWPSSSRASAALASAK